MHRAASHVRGESDTLLQCKYARHNGAGIVRASGDIDLPNVHLFAEMLDQALGDSESVIVDLAEVSYIDSTGLNVLIGLHEQCARRRTNMAVVFTSRNLWRIFSVLDLQEVFRVFPTVDAALRALSHRDERGGHPVMARNAHDEVRVETPRQRTSRPFWEPAPDDDDGPVQHGANKASPTGDG